MSRAQPFSFRGSIWLSCKKKALNPFTSIYIHILLTSLNMLYGFYCARNVATRLFDLQQNVQLSYRAMP